MQKKRLVGCVLQAA